MGMEREKFLTTRTVFPQRRSTLRADGCAEGIAGVSTGHHLERLNERCPPGDLEQVMYQSSGRH